MTLVVCYRAHNGVAVSACRYYPPSQNACPTAVIPAVSAKGKLKVTTATCPARDAPGCAAAGSAAGWS